MPTPTIAQLHQAVAIAQQIEKLQSELAGLVGGSSSSSSLTSPAPGKRGGKRKMSAATIAKMRLSQQARWAKKKGATGDTAAKAAPTPKKKKRKLSPEGRARIVAALKARHAAKKAAAK